MSYRRATSNASYDCCSSWSSCQPDHLQDRWVDVQADGAHERGDPREPDAPARRASKGSSPQSALAVQRDGRSEVRSPGTEDRGTSWMDSQGAEVGTVVDGRSKDQSATGSSHRVGHGWYATALRRRKEADRLIERVAVRGERWISGRALDDGLQDVFGQVPRWSG